MADENKLNGERSASGTTKSAIFDHLSKLRKWREEQFHHFRNMQLIQLQETQKNVDQIYQAHKGKLSPGISEKLQGKNISLNTSGNIDENIEKHSKQDLSLNAHFERCFSDSSHDASSHTSLQTTLTNENESSTLNGCSKNGFQSLEQLLKENTLKTNTQDKKGNDQVPGKPKRQFLKKGAGLQRYMPRKTSTTDTKKSNQYEKRKPVLPPSKLVLKPPSQDADSHPVGKKHVQFDITTSPNANLVPTDKQVKFEIPCFQSSPIKGKHIKEKDIEDSPVNKRIEDVESAAENCEIKNKHFDGVHELLASEDESNASAKNSHSVRRNIASENSEEFLDVNVSIDSALCKEDKQKEQNDLTKFELLENFAQNNSFNSDSSIVQRILDGENVKPITLKCDQNDKPALNGTHIYQSSNAQKEPMTKSGVTKHTINLVDVQKQRQHMQHLLYGTELAISSLDNAIHAPPTPDLPSDDDSSSSPVNVNSIKNIGITEELHAWENSSLDSSSDTIEDVNVSVVAAIGPDPYYLTTDNNFPHIRKENFEVDCMPNHHASNSASPAEQLPLETMSDQSLLKEKLKQLETEIIFFKQQNANLQKDRDKLQNDQQDFKIFQELEKKKFENEMEEARRQFNRGKKSFERFQKMKQDNPTKKERDELRGLKQQVEKLQDELKCKNIKWNNDSRINKNKLALIENERDSLKKENKRLEEQLQDLLTTLKDLKEKLKKQKLKVDNEEKVTEKNKKDILENAKGSGDEVASMPTPQENYPYNSSAKEILQISPHSEGLEVAPRVNSFADSNAQRKVRFDLIPQFTNSIENWKDQRKADFSDNEESEQSLPENELPSINNCASSENHVPDTDGKALCESQIGKFPSVPDFYEIQRGEDIERIYSTGEREILYSNGTRQCISANGLFIRFYYFNGDIREEFPDKRAVYTYLDGTKETWYPDGSKVIEFKNGQVEIHSSSNIKKVQNPDGTSHIEYPNGTVQMQASNGIVLSVAADGTETLEYPNGVKEIHTKLFRRREYPDGAVKILYTSGREETRYVCGRIRLKDEKGHLVVDTKTLGSNRC